MMAGVFVPAALEMAYRENRESPGVLKMEDGELSHIRSLAPALKLGATVLPHGVAEMVELRHAPGGVGRDRREQRRPNPRDRVRQGSCDGQDTSKTFKASGRGKSSPARDGRNAKPDGCRASNGSLL
jgi:hypothetical protein